jgi:chemotaxis protein CheY-P-specific phosphatase CheC
MPEQQLTETQVFFGSLQSVLEKMAFIIADIVDANELDGGGSQLLEATMEFKGDDASGQAVLAAQAEFCGSLAENMLGIDEDEINDSSREDALREILNMTCGLYLTSRWGDGVVFDLTVPEVRRLDDEQWQELVNDEKSIAIDAEGFQMVASVIL